MLTPMQQTMSMTLDDYNNSDSKVSWDFSLAPELKDFFRGTHKLRFQPFVERKKKMSRTSSSTLSTSSKEAEKAKSGFAKEFTISEDVQKLLRGSGAGFNMDGMTTKNRVNSKNVNKQEQQKGNNDESPRKSSFESNLTMVSSNISEIHLLSKKGSNEEATSTKS